VTSVVIVDVIINIMIDMGVVIVMIATNIAIVITRPFCTSTVVNNVILIAVVAIIIHVLIITIDIRNRLYHRRRCRYCRLSFSCFNRHRERHHCHYNHQYRGYHR
jgi:hypothetical protein